MRSEDHLHKAKIYMYKTVKQKSGGSFLVVNVVVESVKTCQRLLNERLGFFFFSYFGSKIKRLGGNLLQIRQEDKLIKKQL